MGKINQDYDSPYKDILEAYFQEFMALFFPLIENDLNWEKGYKFLDKEFQGIVKEAEIGRRYLDKLIQVWRKDNCETWLLIHIEVQGARETGFPERMYVCITTEPMTDIEKACGKAVLADESVSWRPDRFKYELWGCEVSLRFPVVKILDYNKNEKKLLQDKNPFALIVLSQLKAMETRSDPEARAGGRIPKKWVMRQ